MASPEITLPGLSNTIWALSPASVAAKDGGPQNVNVSVGGSMLVTSYCLTTRALAPAPKTGLSTFVTSWVSPAFDSVSKPVRKPIGIPLKRTEVPCEE